MRIISKQGETDLATVYIAQLDDGELIEFVESVQPPVPRHEKWVVIVSTLKGCPVNCPICDAGTRYRGKLTSDEIIGQIDWLVKKYHPDCRVPMQKFKVQFARMGDPAFNPAVTDVLAALPEKYNAPGLLPSISTVAPAGTEKFFEKLTEIKNRFYNGGRFQMQFSLHTSCEKARRELVPVKTWSFARMSEWGHEFHTRGDKKISLNFAAVRGYPLDPDAIAAIFSPDIFLIKLTPVNPTSASLGRGFEGVIDPENPHDAGEIAGAFRARGFDTILSIGETRENQIGSNCGMYVSTYAESSEEKKRQPQPV